MNQPNDSLLPVRQLDQSFLDRIDAVAQAILARHAEISRRKTPTQKIEKRPDGFDYVDEGYMRELLSKEFPVWGWIKGCDPVVIPPNGAEWIMTGGTLWILDSGIRREFYSLGAARVQYKNCSCLPKNRIHCQACGGTGKLPHTPENLIDLDKPVASANTNAFKRAVNRLCNIADDVYQKMWAEDLTDETRQAFEALMAIAPEDVRSRYQTYADNAGGLESASEEMVQQWIGSMKRRMRIPDGPLGGKVVEK